MAPFLHPLLVSLCVYLCLSLAPGTINWLVKLLYFYVIVEFSGHIDNCFYWTAGRLIFVVYSMYISPLFAS